ncbi:ParB/RepB/Spo0J family partition protein [Bythopirellula polymerisocia]|uniref:Putative chromosome-partitioning protein ParB n=1 Tax=Bythopirellula polymerisocia TaxID=2528003 RepID=A0A5C6CX36_9BACT|nr:ParB/RepB/Spo0J family partition protein [Bythopirellula polymerisocia]TWU28435.1 putative chromosome-partitioning protein ParB [Bythopirellula polymerisocia]
MNKDRRLGRGLEALLGFSPDNAPTNQEPSSEGGLSISNGHQATISGEGQQWIDLGLIDANPYQPRQQFDEAEIADLCDSIRTHGFLQPIVVRPFEGRYQIIAGERRHRAANLANWQQVPVLIREVEDRELAELAIVENIQRKDLNALEKAASFQRYIQEYGCTQEELASRVNIDRSTVANLIRLLELPEEVKGMILAGEISQGHGRSLLPLGDDVEQIAFAKKISQESLSVRATERLVQEHIENADGEQLTIFSGEKPGKQVATPSGTSHLTQLEEQLRLALGTKVDLKQSAKGKGKITIHFASHEEFDRLRELLSGSEVPYREAG